MKIELKKFDYIIIGIVVLAVLLGAVLFINKKKIGKTPVISENTVVFQVFFRGVTITNEQNPFVPTEESFITIRNVPHKDVTIVGSKMIPKLTMMMTPVGQPVVVRDAGSPFMFDCLVTLVDDAKITEDGAVLGGNKLKTGLPIVLEGKDYRLNGTVSSVKVLKADEAKEIKEAIEQEKSNIENAKNGVVNMPIEHPVQYPEGSPTGVQPLSVNPETSAQTPVNTPVNTHAVPQKK